MAKEVIVSADRFFLERKANRALTHRGDFLMGYRIAYAPMYTQSEEEFFGLSGEWNKALRNMPVSTVIVKSDIFRKRRFDGADMPADTFLQKATGDYFDQREYLEHNGYVFFIFPLKDTLKNQRISNPFVFPSREVSEQERLKQKQFISQVGQAVELLNLSGSITLSPLDEEQLEAVAGLWMNGFNEEYLTDAEFKEEYVKSGNHYLGMYAINSERAFPEAVDTAVKDDSLSMPEEGILFYQGMMDEFGVRLNYNHVYNQILFLDEHKRHVNTLYKQERVLRGARKFGHENAVGAERTKQYIEELAKADSEDVRFIRGHSNIIFFSDDMAEFRMLEEIIPAKFQKMEFQAYRPTGDRLRDLYLNSLFVNASGLSNDSLYLVDLRVAVSLFVNNSTYDNDREGIYFQDRIYNIPRRFDWWDAGKKRLTSRNFGIFAPTGRGKSVLLNNIVSGVIDNQDTVVVIIDLGRSYERLAQLYPPEQVAYFRYENGKPLGLNPFALEPTETEPSAFKMDVVCNFVWKLVKKNETPSEKEKTSLRKLVDAYYVLMLEEGRREELSWFSFYNFIKTEGEAVLKDLRIEPGTEYFDLKEFLHTGSEFMPGGSYGNICMKAEDGNGQIFSGKKLIIFELAEIRESELLLSIMLLVIADTNQKVIWEDKQTRGIVIWEEFAESLKFPGVLALAAWYAQAIRKQEGAMGIVMQTINQFPDNELSKSIIDNMETLIALPTDKLATVEALAKRCDLSPHDVVQLRSMRHKFDGERTYSECLIKRGRFSRVFRLELPLEVKCAYFNDGPIAAEMRSLEKQHNGNIEEAIRHYVEIHSQKNQ